MVADEDFGWRDRAIALASLGAAALSRDVFATVDVIDEKPLQPVEMQVLVALALKDSLVVDPPPRTGADWLSRALRLERWVVDEIIRSLERASLVRRSPPAQDAGELEYELAEDDDEDVIAFTELGRHAVERWLGRTRRRFGSWPPERPDVDDAVA